MCDCVCVCVSLCVYVCLCAHTARQRRRWDVHAWQRQVREGKGTRIPILCCARAHTHTHTTHTNTQPVWSGLVFGAQTTDARRVHAPAGQATEAYMVAQKRSLLEMVRMRPTTKAELRSVWGLAAARIDKHGQDLLDIVNAPDNAVLLRQGRRPVLDFKDGSGVDVASAEGGRRKLDAMGDVIKGGGSRWKALSWEALDRLDAEVLPASM